VQANTVADGCPDCGVVSERVHAWSRQRVKDIPQAGGIELVVAGAPKDGVGWSQSIWE